MSYITTISVSPEFHQLAKDNHISWSEAARVGMSICLAERGIKQYDNNLNLFRKMTAFRLQAETALQKLAELEAKNAVQG